MIALQGALSLHASLGGTYIVATPAYIYTGLILTSLRDVTPANEKKKQTMWQWDFEQPLLTVTQSQSLLGNLMSSFSNGTQVPASTNPWSSPGAAINNPVGGNAATSSPLGSGNFGANASAASGGAS
jgi:hypothetical protein